MIRQGLAGWRATGAGTLVPTVLTFLAEAHGARGEIDEALHTLAEAEVLIEKNGERWWESETHRLKGELLLSMSSDNAPESETASNTSKAPTSSPATLNRPPVASVISWASRSELEPDGQL